MVDFSWALAALIVVGIPFMSFLIAHGIAYGWTIGRLRAMRRFAADAESAGR